MSKLSKSKLAKCVIFLTLVSFVLNALKNKFWVLVFCQQPPVSIEVIISKQQDAVGGVYDETTVES